MAVAVPVPAGCSYASIYITNNLMADLSNPEPHIIHGTPIGADNWPTILRGKTSDEIRINALTPNNGVEGSVKYSSFLLGHRRKATFFFTCNNQRNAASATSSDPIAVAVIKMSPKAPLVVTYRVQELLD